MDSSALGAEFGMSAARTKKVEALDSTAPDAKAVEAIGKALEAHYSSLVKAPLPDKFVELLARLEGKESPQTKGTSDALD
jgi:Anti-sigma factor NepR